MPSTRLDGTAFTSIDWAAQDDRRRVRLRTVGFVAAVLALAATFAYDYWPHSGPLWGTYYLQRIDWLFGFGLAVFFVVALVAPEFRGIGRANLSQQLQPPVLFSVPADSIPTCIGPTSGGQCHGTLAHPFGTSGLGIDVLSWVVYGMREILMVVLSAAAMMGIIATTVGATAGYYGGRVNDVLMRYVDIQQTVPTVVIYVFVATLVLRDKGLVVLALFFDLPDWAGIARLVRNNVLKQRGEGYVRAARDALDPRDGGA